MLGSVAPTAKAGTSPGEIKVERAGNIKLALYSISYGGIWYQGKALSFEELVKTAKEFGFDGIELDNKRPLGNPMNLNQARRDEMKNVLAKDLGAKVVRLFAAWTGVPIQEGVGAMAISLLSYAIQY